MGSGITLIVGQSADAPAQVIPKLIGFPLREAKSRIWEAGMNVGKVEFDPEIDLLSRLSARVYYQSPGQSVRAAQGTTINLKLTLDDKKLDKESAASDRSAKVQAARDQQADESAATQP